MLTANELRIGNFLFYEETIDDHEPKQINGADIAMFNTLASRYLPIPLTEEWLVRLGFDNQTSKDCWIFYKTVPYGRIAIAGLKDNKDRKFPLQELHGPNSDGDYEGSYSIVSINELDYVHQLQNLYFALTGKELTYNNKP